MAFPQKSAQRSLESNSGCAMGTGEFPAVHAASIPMRYAVLLRDLRLSVPVFDDNFNPEEFATIFGALKGLQVRMVTFEHHLDKIELGMGKLEHRIHAMELHMQHLLRDVDLADPDPDPAHPDRPPSAAAAAHRDAALRLARELP